MSSKYPRTPHLPFSPGGTSDDRRIDSLDAFVNTNIVLTEKLDGSNVCLEREACFARSHASAPNHPSFDAFKAFHSSVKHSIDPGIQIFGEWCYAKHSISYLALPHHFLVFGVRDLHKGIWASWELTELWAEFLGTVTVPTLEVCLIGDARRLEKLIVGHAAEPSRCGGLREGLVIRKAGEFKDEDFANSVAKWVRKDHVQTDDHWKSQEIVRNGVSGV